VRCAYACVCVRLRELTDACCFLQPPLCRPRTSWPPSRRSATS
jgi:hypothetical protein